MDPITGAMLVGGMGSIIGGIGQSQSNAMNIDQARENREWQMHMSNSAHQREVTDLKGAGLNPILSAGGSGASTPTGDSAQGLGSPMNSLAAGISKGADTALAIRGQNAEVNLKNATEKNVKEDTFNKKETGALITQQTLQTAKDIEAKKITNKYLDESLKAQLQKAKSEGKYSEINQIMGIINSGTSSAKSIIDSVPLIKSTKELPKAWDSIMNQPKK